MKGVDVPDGDAGDAKGPSGAPAEFKGIRRAKLTMKVEPGEKLLWRKVDGVWSKYLVDASVRS